VRIPINSAVARLAPFFYDHKRQAPTDRGAAFLAGHDRRMGGAAVLVTGMRKTGSQNAVKFAFSRSG
jgi:hypothetical protein